MTADQIKGAIHKILDTMEKAQQWGPPAVAGAARLGIQGLLDELNRDGVESEAEASASAEPTVCAGLEIPCSVSFGFPEQRPETEIKLGELLESIPKDFDVEISIRRFVD